MSAEIRESPSLVPVSLVVDFDFIHPEGADTDPCAALKRLHDGPDIFMDPTQRRALEGANGDGYRARRAVVAACMERALTG